VLSSVPRRRRLQSRLVFTRLIQFLFLRVVLVKAAPVFLQVICLVGTATNQVIGLGIAHSLRRMQTKVPDRAKLITIVLKKFHLVR
jgi:hypothetical protein